MNKKNHLSRWFFLFIIIQVNFYECCNYKSYNVVDIFEVKDSGSFSPYSES
jgi:hypothetical protein